ncbi:GQ67_01513T0 [Komagataella phaffii]|nr:GQ67_01513T0 [Komagataella phaffii]AOA65745.1 GQ68_01529T0 [Komagataella phaffii GS115]CAH2447311.1 Predicted protein [Komagataella phaffii CBS 7435]
MSPWKLNLSHDWFYFRLQIPQTNATVDLITWKLLVSHALNLYGLLGQSLHFDILHNERNTCIIRCYETDRQTFTTAITTITWELKEAGLEGEGYCCLRILNSSKYLLGVTEDRHPVSCR